MLNTLQNQVISMAGLFQAGALVKQLAYQGRCDTQDLEYSLHSIMTLDSSNVEEVYQGHKGVKLGLETLLDQLGGNAEKRNAELSRYIVTLLHLEARLRSNNNLLERISDGISRQQAHVSVHGIDNEAIGHFAEIYQSTISKMTPRVMVNGETAHLSNEQTAARIRAVLLAGMRSAVLWRQCGGSRLKLLFKRNAYINEAKVILKNITE